MESNELDEYLSRFRGFNYTPHGKATEGAPVVPEEPSSPVDPLNDFSFYPRVPRKGVILNMDSPIGRTGLHLTWDPNNPIDQRVLDRFADPGFMPGLGPPASPVETVEAIGPAPLPPGADRLVRTTYSKIRTILAGMPNEDPRTMAIDLLQLPYFKAMRRDRIMREALVNYARQYESPNSFYLQAMEIAYGLVDPTSTSYAHADF